MRRAFPILAAALALALPYAGRAVAGLSPQATTKPDVITLGQQAKLGPITFNHTNHTTKYLAADGKKIACIECHHTAQPAAEAAKTPPLKTVWPADRTTTLTDELFAKDPAGAGVVDCHQCHARAGETPKLIPANPQISGTDGTTMITVTNQLAFHRNCAGCHAQVLKVRPDASCPTPQQCSKCHNRE